VIATVRGRLVEAAENEVVLQIGGVGLKIGVPAAVCTRYQVEDELKLFTCMVVREDNITLYGFETREENEVFHQFLRVSGVGPRLALSILSTLSVDQVYQAVVGEQPALFNQVPGIGSKTAQKIVLMLKDRLKAHLGEHVWQAVRDTDSDLLEALVGLGYSVVEAQAAIQALPKDAPDDLEEKMRMALRYFNS
jgi:holliday junction DNA helicase RuvA